MSQAVSTSWNYPQRTLMIQIKQIISSTLISNFKLPIPIFIVFSFSKCRLISGCLIPAHISIRGGLVDIPSNDRKAKAATYSPAIIGSTIGAGELNFSVRNGKRWNLTAIAALLSLISITTLLPRRTVGETRSPSQTNAVPGLIQLFEKERLSDDTKDE